MRRINYLTVSAFRTQVDRIILDTSEVSAPPCRIIRRICFRIRLPPDKAVVSYWLLNTLNENECIRIYIKNRIGTFCCGICPVVFICWTIPFCSGWAFLTFSVRFVLEVICKKCIIIFIFICQPYKRIYPQISCNHCSIRCFFSIPQRIVMTWIVCMRAVNINKCFQSVFFTLVHYDVEYFHAVFYASVSITEVSIDCITRVNICLNTWNCIRLSVHPWNKKFGRNRKTDNVDTMVSNSWKSIININAPQIVRASLTAV